MGFPGGSDGKASACNAGDPGSIPGWGRSPGEGNGYPLQYSCLEISMDTGAWRTTVDGATQSDMTEQLTLYTISLVSLKLSFQERRGGMNWEIGINVYMLSMLGIK